MKGIAIAVLKLLIRNLRKTQTQYVEMNKEKTYRFGVTRQAFKQMKGLK